MQYLGFFMVVVAMATVVFGFLQRSKMKKILAAPFRKTAEANNPQSADAKGMISVEGAIGLQQPFIAPMSGRPCVYYEIEIQREVKKHVTTENGTKEEKKKSNVHTENGGAYFLLNDGSGPVSVDARKDVVAGDLVKSFEQGTAATSGDVIFGQHQVNIKPHFGEGVALGLSATEKIIPAEGNLFAMGKLANGAIGRPDGMLGKLLISTKGRDKLVGSTKRNMTIGFAAAGLSFVIGLPVSIFADAPVDACANMVDAQKDGACSARVSNKDGDTKQWKVATAGTYTFKVTPTGANKMLRLWPDLTVSKGAAKWHKEGDESGVTLTAKFEPGDYSINVKEAVEGHTDNIKGGLGYSLEITSAGAAAPVTSAPKAVAAGVAK